MKTIKNILIDGLHERPILTDVFYKENKKPKPIVIFCHGYKGFKDWGAWNLAAEAFAKHDYFFIKFNFSHNGGTVENPIDFPDLEAFGNNNYTKELDDLETVINWILNNENFTKEIDKNQLYLIGHSRAGGIVTLKASENNKVAKLVSWAGVANFANRFPKKEALENWKKDGVFYVINGRTKQQMPHFYQYYEDFKQNENRLNIQKAVQNLKIPHLVLHGTQDESVPVSEALLLHRWNTQSQLVLIDDTNHTFGVSHPHLLDTLPEKMNEVVSATIKFLLQ